ncbi:helix-turn-helix domain-containing protein [Weissella confusa]
MQNRLKELRNQHGYSLKYVSEKVGISVSALGNYESGIRNPKYETWRALADLYNVSVSYIQGIAKYDFMNTNENGLSDISDANMLRLQKFDEEYSNNLSKLETLFPEMGKFDNMSIPWRARVYKNVKWAMEFQAGIWNGSDSLLEEKSRYAFIANYAKFQDQLIELATAYVVEDFRLKKMTGDDPELSKDEQKYWQSIQDRTTKLLIGLSELSANLEQLSGRKSNTNNETTQTDNDK